jgi:uncharacterized protein (DUF2384 family)
MMAAKVGKSKALMSLLVEREVSFSALYCASAMDRIEMVKMGVPSRLIRVLVGDLNMPVTNFLEMLDLSRTTINRKIRAGRRLSLSEGDSVLDVGRLVGQVEEAARTARGAQRFDAGRWLSAWLQVPLAALDGLHPSEFMDTHEGRALLSRLIAQTASTVGG